MEFHCWLPEVTWVTDVLDDDLGFSIQNVQDTSFAYTKARPGQSPLVVQVPAGQAEVDWDQIRLIAVEAQVSVEKFVMLLSVKRQQASG